MNDMARLADRLRTTLLARNPLPTFRKMLYHPKNTDEQIVKLFEEDRRYKTARMKSDATVKALAQAGQSLIAMMIVCAIMLLLAAAILPNAFRAVQVKNAANVADKIARIVNAEQVYSLYLNGYLAPQSCGSSTCLPLTGNVSQVWSCSNPGLLTGPDAQLTAPGYALAFTPNGGAGAPVTVACPGGKTGIGGFAITATPSIASGRYFQADPNVNGGQIQFRDGAAGSWNPYVASLKVPYQLTVTATNTNPQPTQPPLAINDTVITCGTVTPQNVCGTVSIQGPNKFTCFPVASGVVAIIYTGACASAPSGSLAPTGYPVGDEIAVGAVSSYSTFSVSLLSMNPYLDGAAVGPFEVLTVSLVDISTNVTLATCDIVGAQAADPNGFAAVSPYNFCSNKLKSTPAPGDFLAVIFYTPTNDRFGSSEAGSGADGINFTTL